MSHQLQSRLNHLACVGYDPSRLADAFPTLWIRIDRHIKEGQTNMDGSGNGSASGSTSAGSTSVRAVSVDTSQPVVAPLVSLPQDKLDIPSADNMRDRLNETPEMRAARIARIKAAIENGAYDSDEKLAAAMSRMFDSLGIDLHDE